MINAERTGRARHRCLTYDMGWWFRASPKTILVLQVQWRISGYDVASNRGVDYFEWRDARSEDVTETTKAEVVHG